MIKSNVKLATFDIETDPFNYGDFPLPFACDFFDGISHFTFWGDDCVRRCYEQRLSKFKGIVFAHNGGKFDFHYLLRYLPKPNLNVFIIKNRLVSLKLRELEFRDSYALMPVPLRDYKKEEIEIDKLSKGRREENRDEIIRYLKGDTEFLLELIVEFKKKFGLGLTIRGRAFDQLRKFGYEIPETNYEYDNQLRRFYFGGRCECFASGKIVGSLSVADINSAYPYAMLEKHPWSTSYYQSDRLPKRNFGACFIRATVEGRGCFPLRTKDHGLLFPAEKTEYHFTGWEYFAAIECGSHQPSDFDIREVLVPYDTISFADFIHHFYQLRLKAKKENNKADSLFAKLFMNSCYGGFALDPSRYKKYKITELGELPHDDNDSTEWEHTFDNDFAGISVFESPEPGEKYFNVLTAASITGFVRAMLLRAILSHAVLYCDTDSIIYRGRNNLDYGNALGQWKLEATGNELYLAGKKLYAFKKDDGDWKTASKGVELSASQIKSVALGNKVVYKRDAPVYSFKNGLSFLTRVVQNTNKKKGKYVN
jgi:DNA polymerase type B, organellar and viral